jgi:outer membrane protein OmpA-like peptidoglycan-associated protein
MKALIFLLCLGIAVPTYGLRYATDLDQSQWITETSPYVCRLEHYINGYGTGAFVHHAGETRRLEMDGQGIMFGAEKITVLAQPPTWQPRRSASALAETAVKQGELRLDESLATQVAARLLEGMMVEFRGTLRENVAQPLEVQLSTVGFRGAFDEFTACEDQLLPANFAQLERSRVQYGPGQIELDGNGRQLLNKIARYLEVDHSVRQIFIDGHTDSEGLTRDNVKISQQRAQLVYDYLVSQGVDENLLVVRFHAEKYPVARNNTPANRAKNRRTTVRLSREFVPQDPPDAVRSDDGEAQTASEDASRSADKPGQNSKANNKPLKQPRPNKSTNNRGGSTEVGE